MFIYKLIARIFSTPALIRVGSGKNRVQHLTFRYGAAPVRKIVDLINRSHLTIESPGNRVASGGYSYRAAQRQMQARRQVCRPM